MNATAVDAGRGVVRTRRWRALGAAAAMAAAWGAMGQSAAPFPDDWFFYEAKRPKELRELEGKRAPEISTAKWIGESVKLADLRGKVVIVDFWATWCGPCVAAIPKNVELVNQYKNEGLVFIGMHDAGSGWDRADAMVRDKGINYPVALDESEGKSGKSTKAYQIQFWPTYVAIDRSGVIRAAGLKPDKVKDVVRALLAEPYEAPSGAGAGGRAGAEFPAEWYFGGENRPASLRALEGKTAPSIEAASWIGRPATTARRVVVVQFVRPEMGLSLTQMDALAPIAARYGRQGAAFVAVCDARSDRAAMEREVEARRWGVPVAMDKPLPEGEEGPGVTTRAFGATMGPTTIVIDRSGVVRAAGLRPEHVEAVLDRLLAERMPPSGRTGG